MKVIKCFYQLYQFCRDRVFVKIQIQSSRSKVKENLSPQILILVKYLSIRTGETLMFLISAPKLSSTACFLITLVLLLL